MKALGRLFGLSVYTKIPYRSAFLLSLLLFSILVVGYITVSYMRHAENPGDKIMPTVSQLLDGAKRAISIDRNGERPIIEDTLASLKRLGLGVFIGAFFGIVIGISMGLFPLFEALLLRFVLYVGKIPPLAILPLIFVFVGIGEQLKVILIIIGLAFPIALDTYFNVSPASKRGVPRELLVKALSLGANTPEMVSKIVLPQIMPAALNAIRLNLLNAWLFLIASEAIAADVGLGYRIFLVRRYLAMDTIIPYVLWIAMLSFLFDAVIAWFIRHRYPWYQEGAK